MKLYSIICETALFVKIYTSAKTCRATFLENKWEPHIRHFCRSPIPSHDGSGGSEERQRKSKEKEGGWEVWKGKENWHR